jgi:predicted membrane protein
MNISALRNFFARIAAFFSAIFAHPFALAIRDRLRAVSLLIIAAITLWLIAVPNPFVQNTNAVKVGLIAWLICKESVLAYLGYWIDRLLHPKSRPGDLQDIERMAAEKRRAFIVCAAMIAGGLYQ